jgi:serine/threonine-protein kinase ATR
MGRKVSAGLPAQTKSSHGNHSSGDLPPSSTIAAQIVHNRAKATREEPEYQELFGKLLQEYLKDPIVEEASLETNAQLISVVAEAGLDAVRKDDPFAPDAATRRAVDSLQVIQLTVQRSPRILFFNGSTTALDGSKPPLILWLLPKVLGLAGPRRTQTIQDQITSFLSTCINALLKSTQLWCKGKEVVHLVRTMVQGKP